MAADVKIVSSKDGVITIALPKEVARIVPASPIIPRCICCGGPAHATREH